MKQVRSLCLVIDPEQHTASFHSSIKLTAEKKATKRRGGQTLPPTDSYKEAALQASAAANEAKAKSASSTPERKFWASYSLTCCSSD